MTNNRGRESSNINGYYYDDHSLINDVDRTLTVILYESTLYVYIDAKLIRSFATSNTEPCCGYTTDAELTFALYFANNAPAGKMLTLLTNEYGDSAKAYIQQHYSGDITVS